MSLATRTQVAPPAVGRDRHRRLKRNLWLLLLFLVVGYLVLVPVAMVIWGSFRTVPAGVEGALTLENYRQALSSPALRTSMINTLVFGVGSTLLACTLGTYLAWLTERTDVPFRRPLRVLALLPLVVPGILTTVAWTLVLNERIGIGNTLLANVPGVTGPVFDAYTMPAMIWADGTDSITLPFLLMAAAFRSMDPALEEASLMSGSSQRRTLRSITLPLMTPAILASALLVFITTIGNFAVPAAMGLPGGIRVLATDVYLATRSFPTDTNLAATYAVLYLLIALVGLLLYHRAVRSSEGFVTVTGRGARATLMRLGASRRLHGVAALAILGVSVIVPLLVMIYASLLRFYTPPTVEVWSEFTLRNYRWVLFESAAIERALRNNVVAGGTAAVVTVLLAAVIAWVVIRTRVRGRFLLDAVASAPLAFPGMVIALALMWLYLILPVPIYATLWIITLAYVTAFLPYALRATHATLSQVGVVLEEASTAAGAAWSWTFVRIVLPLISTGLLVGFIYVFARTFKVLSLPVLLAGPGNEVLPVLIFDLYQDGRFPQLNALGVLLSAFLLVVFVIAERIAARIGQRSVEAEVPRATESGSRR